MEDTFPVCGGLGHEDPLELLTFCQFSRGDVSTWIISKGETTTWGLTGPGWDCGEIFREYCGLFSKVGLIFNSIVRDYLYYLSWVTMVKGLCRDGWTGIT